MKQVENISHTKMGLENGLFKFVNKLSEQQEIYMIRDASN